MRLSSNLCDFSWKSHDGKLCSKEIEWKAVQVPLFKLKISTRLVKVVSGHFLMEFSNKKSTVWTFFVEASDETRNLHGYAPSECPRNRLFTIHSSWTKNRAEKLWKCLAMNLLKITKRNSVATVWWKHAFLQHVIKYILLISFLSPFPRVYKKVRRVR